MQCWNPQAKRATVPSDWKRGGPAKFHFWPLLSIKNQKDDEVVSGVSQHMPGPRKKHFLFTCSLQKKVKKNIYAMRESCADSLIEFVLSVQGQRNVPVSEISTKMWLGPNPELSPGGRAACKQAWCWNWISQLVNLHEPVRWFSPLTATLHWPQTCGCSVYANPCEKWKPGRKKDSRRAQIQSGLEPSEIPAIKLWWKQAPSSALKTPPLSHLQRHDANMASCFDALGPGGFSTSTAEV